MMALFVLITLLASIMAQMASEMPLMACSAQWQCDLPNITDDFNFVQCVDSVCTCRTEQGFIGLGNLSKNSSDPRLDNSQLDINGPCHCPDSFTLIWEEGIPFCRDNRLALPCTAQWQCDDVTTNFQFVQCNMSGICECRHDQGFVGAGTIDDPCICPDNNTMIWEGDLLFCLNASLPLNCTQQWQCQEVSDNFNFVECASDGLCRCLTEQGFVGNATHDDLCRCNLTLEWVNNTAFCLDLPTEARLVSTQIPELALNCTQQFQCAGAAELFQAVNCTMDRCICESERGFTGNGTVDLPCRCEEPRIILWQDGLPFCIDIHSISSS